MDKDRIQKSREFLKDTIRLKIDFSYTDQSKGIQPPPVQKPYSEDQKVVKLPKKADWQSVPEFDLVAALGKRKSRRKFRDIPLKLDELAFLLWATQGVKRVLDQGHAFRTVPSAGCRHAFETYLAVLNVESLDRGIYRYLPLEHALVLEKEVKQDLPEQVIMAVLGQEFAGRSAVTFIWTTIPYRMEWRYDAAAHKVIAIDAGHVCQNLYLAVEAIGAGTCSIAAYHQEKMDELVGVDGENEFTIYLAPVGKL